MIKYFLFLISISIFLSCKKDKPDLSTINNTAISTGVFIVNEGNFTWGNSSISYYDFNTKTIVDDIYKQANALPLGDVAQSMVEIAGNYFIVVNNSKKIEVVNASSFKKTATISGFRSPRYCLQTGINKLYVSDLYDNHISIVDLTKNEIVGKIFCKGWTEQMVQYKNKVFVTNLYSQYLYIINANNDALLDSIDIGFASNSICIDKENKIWVACSGKNPTNIKSKIHKINPEKNQIEQTFEVESTVSTICINLTKDTLYFLNKGVYQFANTINSLPTTPLISGNGKQFYGLGIAPKSGDVFVSDALDYVQQGNVYWYNNKGEIKAEFKAGIIPNGFVFK